MAKKSKNVKRERPRERRERRFEPRSTTSALLVYVLGAVGALAMGAGFWGQFGPSFASTADAGDPIAAAPWILTGGAILVGIAVWIGTSGEPPLRVGDGGIALEKRPIRRMPWYAVERIEWRGEALRITGKDDAGSPMPLVVKAGTFPQGAAWIVKEARARVPAVVDVPEDATLPEPTATGETLVLDPPQVVGKHCAASGKVISFEPDARVCPRCERVYHKAHVPETCACGAPLDALRSEVKTA